MSLQGFLGQVIDISMDHGTIKIDVELQTSWKDRRAVFQNIHKGRETRIMNEKAEAYWQPDIFLSGVVNEDAWKLSMAKAPGIMTVTAEEEGYPSVFGSKEGESSKVFFDFQL